jgi:UDP-N-acetylmuramoyl-L-alanyl-D-glutamate--2,6-diaminopimelate ligase
MKNITGITSDSREVKKGYAFVAINGNHQNGEEFIGDAIKNGAEKIIVGKDSIVQDISDIEIIRVDNPRLYLSELSAQVYSNQPKFLTAVTGTSGKTSTAYFYKEICSESGFKSASIGTLGVISDEIEFDTYEVLTSPPAPLLHKILNDLAKKQIDHVCVEASSHGLDQYRLESIHLKAAGFTNFSRDHLDYHKGMSDYFASKMRLFNTVLKEGIAVINADIPEYQDIIAHCAKHKVLTYGKKGEFIKLKSSGENYLVLEIDGKEYSTEFTLAATFQTYNLMCALGLALAVGVKVDNAVEAIAKLKTIPGRLEYVGEHNGAAIYVDYAHKPEALEIVLKSLKEQCQGKLHVLFGCGGDRDKGKRPIMGEIASRFADHITVTDDNPRSEDPAEIRAEILASCPQAIEIGDRAKAIHHAISQVKKNDILVLAGKGHEEYQIVGDNKIHFSDMEEAKRYIDNISKILD